MRIPLIEKAERYYTEYAARDTEAFLRAHGVDAKFARYAADNIRDMSCSNELGLDDEGVPVSKMPSVRTLLNGWKEAIKYAEEKK